MTLENHRSRYHNSLRNDITEDLWTNTGVTLVAGAATLAWLAFQWGFGNDVLLPTITARVYNAIEQPPNWQTGITAAAAATAAGGAFWALTQLLDTVIVLAGLRLLPRVSHRLGNWLTTKHLIIPYDQMRPTTRWAIAYVAGASAVCLIDALATGQPGIARRRTMIAQTIALSAGTITLIVATVTTATMAGQRTPALQPAASTLANYAANPLTWVAVVAVIALAGRICDRSRRGSQAFRVGSEKP